MHKLLLPLAFALLGVAAHTQAPAAIEGPGRDGTPRRVEYPYKRVKP